MVLDALVEVVASKYRAFSQPLSHRQGVLPAKAPNQPLHRRGTASCFAGVFAAPR